MSPSITVAISCLNEGFHKVMLNSYPKHPKINYLLVHQIVGLSIDRYIQGHKHLKQQGFNIIVSTEKGLSRSRNLAIENCDTDYIIFSDDDNNYDEELYNIISRIIFKNKECQFFSFIISDNQGEHFKKYPSVSHYHTKRSILRLSSIENCYLMSFLKDNKVRFNESFGLGSIYPACEQPIFASDIINCGGKGIFVPEVITYHP
ncbi:glycosyltransferase family 2 protein, partial [Vibrio metschnikovii]|nr:glycosyltransferase family 2 protein [Vibrio metschnikovii]